MHEFEELIRRDPDVISPAPKSRHASRPFLLVLSAFLLWLATVAVGAATHAEGGLLGIPIAISGALLVAGARLVRSDYEDSINWLIWHQTNPAGWSPNRWTLPRTHEDRRRYIRQSAGAFMFFGCFAIFIGLLMALAALSS